MFHRATGIGSFPHENAGDALAIIKKNLKYIPHWPQLPRKDSREGFIRQYLVPLIDAGLIKLGADNNVPFFSSDETGWDEKLLNYYELILHWESSPESPDNPFAFSPDSAEGFYAFINEEWQKTSAEYLKGQISGPVTVGLQVNDPRGSPAFYDDQLREVLIKTLSCQVAWQVKRLKAFGLPVIVFIDEPGIYGYGTSGYVGLGRKEIQESLSEINESLKNAGGISGVHCCAGVDWSLLLELPIDIVNFDAYGYFQSLLVYTEALSDFLERGGCLAWGIVPTSADIEKENAENLYEDLLKKIDTLAFRGVDGLKLRKQLSVTPACGAATLTEEQTIKAYRLLAELEELIVML